MPQISLYIDEETMAAMRSNAAAQDVSLSKYVGSILHEHATPKWPKNYWKLYGSITDPSFAAPEELPFELDAKRGTFA